MIYNFVVSECRYRVGVGFDSHALVSGRVLILGGVKIEHSKGLLGHSDGDVVIHSLIDALLGASGLPDIGELYPSDDDAYKGISSLSLLKSAYDLVLKNGYEIVNADITIIANEPKISNFKGVMIDTISSKLRTERDNINIKGKTFEGIDGGCESIASISVVMLKSMEGER